MCGPDLKIVWGLGGVDEFHALYTYVWFKFVIMNMYYHSTGFSEKK